MRRQPLPEYIRITRPGCGERLLVNNGSTISFIKDSAVEDTCCIKADRAC